jgi:retron-type reverse transcriptase
MPKTYNNLIGEICTFENIYEAYLKARKCKRYTKEVLKFSANLEEELLILQEELTTDTYRTGAYRNFKVYEPKKREISALPFRDRVVHHAICRVIEPLFEKKFIKDSYACRVRKGTHAGSDRLMEFLRRAKRTWGRVYCLQADISKFFYSVDHQVLKEIIRRTIRCRNTVRLLDEIIDSTGGGKGLPIGNLTSQLFANVYLNELDHFIKEHLKVQLYIRYLDDFVLLDPDKVRLRMWRGEIEQLLNNRLFLSFNAKTSIFPITQGVDFLGYRTWVTHRLLRKRSIIGMKRKLKYLAKLYAMNQKTLKEIHAVIASWLGHAKHADGHGVAKRVLGSVVLKKM